MSGINHFDADVASRYDETSANMYDPEILEPAVTVLAELAGGGDALEFGVGTGRIALPLSDRGVSVHGIDLSAAMIEQLRAKPDSHRVGTTLGDFSTTTVTGAFMLVYLLWNTIMNLTTQDEQVDCFHNAAAHLEPGGCFVVETMVPDLQRLPAGETVRPFRVSADRLGFDSYDVAAQRLVSHHHWVQDGDARAVSIPFRYVWPAELDLMARLAGMTLRNRWGGWRREAFTSESSSHVSVWQKD